jgi:hypothetical protein
MISDEIHANGIFEMLVICSGPLWDTGPIGPKACVAIPDHFQSRYLKSARPRSDKLQLSVRYCLSNLLTAEMTAPKKVAIVTGASSGQLQSRAALISR